MNTTTINAARAATFEPVEWLSRFESCGGGYSVNPDGELCTGYLLHGRTPDQQQAACQMVNSLTGDEKDALRAFIIAKRDGAAGPDAEILAAWDRRAATLTMIRSLPLQTPDDSQIMRTAWEKIESAETTIQKQTAMTLAGLEIQLWLAAYHISHGPDLDAALTERDFETVAAKEGDLDFDNCLIVSAIRSIRAMEA